MARPRARRFSGMSSAYAGVKTSGPSVKNTAGDHNVSGLEVGGDTIGNGAGLAGDKSKTFGIGAANASGVPIDGNTFGSLRLGVSDPSYPPRPLAPSSQAARSPVACERARSRPSWGSITQAGSPAGRPWGRGAS